MTLSLVCQALTPKENEVARALNIRPLMSIATFLYLKTGRNIFKPERKVDEARINPAPVVALSSSIDPDDIHIGPRGGKYRFDARGRKVYLKSA
ncbi:hypothetical protein [Synechococcus sp. A15-28]|uniref:hypothetical protein n=1 Tax=Synechococcus sp. A15-28 TaxID=1050638 RepID=UPI0016472FDD|nr:hypothetical protein [Synechococcus sp. A15-28]